MSARRTTLAAALVAGLALTGAAVSQAYDSATPAAPATSVRSGSNAAAHLHRFLGTVTQARPAEHWLQMRVGSRSVRIHTGHGTHWYGCGWDDMDQGHRVDVRATASTVPGWRGRSRTGMEAGTAVRMGAGTPGT
jgi:hypothetical protein